MNTMEPLAAGLEYPIPSALSAHSRIFNPHQILKYVQNDKITFYIITKCTTQT